MSNDLNTLVADISSWIACESPSSDPDGLTRMAEIAAKQARQAGLRVELSKIGEKQLPLLLVSNRAPGDLRPGLLILAHLDTVHPIGTIQKANRLRIEGDKLFGPGSYDMKAGAYLALTALCERAASDQTKLPVDYLLVPDEEVGSHDSRPYIEKYAAQAKYTLVAEPARADGGKCVTARKGTGMVKICVTGCQSHAGVNHEKGRSAIKEMAHQVLAVESFTDYVRGITVSVGTIQGGTATNTVPGYCEAIVDFRIPDAPAGDEILAKFNSLKAIGPDTKLDVDVELNRPPMVKTLQSAALLARLQDQAAEAGFHLEDAPMTGGGSDANFTSAMGVPSIDGLGADGDGAHTLNEHILISTLPKRLQFWRNTLANLD
jgi:glutamate carboxypeptidase